MKVLVKRPQETTDPLIISYLSLRKSVGVLGVALPFASILGSYLFSDCNVILPSISQYYYSVMGDLVVGTLCGVAIFLFSYKGYDLWDRYLSNAAGVFAVGTAFFPTHLNPTYMSCYRITQDCTDVTDLLHTIFAALFFITLSVISIWLFTKNVGPLSPEKRLRNKIYRTCGYTMLISITLIAVYRIPIIHVRLAAYKPTVILETIALSAFGFSWLTKGQFLLKDK